MKTLFKILCLCLFWVSCQNTESQIIGTWENKEFGIMIFKEDGTGVGDNNVTEPDDFKWVFQDNKLLITSKQYTLDVICDISNDSLYFKGSHLNGNPYEIVWVMKK